VLGRYGDGGRLPAEIAAVDRALDGLLSKVLASEKFEGKPGQISHFHTGGKLPAERILVVGLGPGKRGDKARDAEPLRRAAAAAVRRARDLGAATIALSMPAEGLTARERAQAIAEGAGRQRPRRAASSASGTSRVIWRVATSMVIGSPSSTRPIAPP